MSFRAPKTGATQTHPAPRTASTSNRLTHRPNAHRPSSDIVVPSRPSGRVDIALSDYASGTLSPARHVLMQTLISLNPDVAQRVAPREDRAAAMLHYVRAVPLSPWLIGETLDVLSRLPSPAPANDRAYAEKPDAPFTPDVLSTLIEGCIHALNWVSYVPGVAAHDIIGNRKTEGDRLYLLRVKAGVQMPEHTHSGEEWALILSGAYRAGKTTYRRGDLHFANEQTSHAPDILEGEDCICLVMASGKLRMNGVLPRLAQAMIGI